MLPNHADDQQPLSSLASFYREQLFKEHPHRLQVPIPFFIYVKIYARPPLRPRVHRLSWSQIS